MDPIDLNNLSELDSLSDSDWLDIASSRASEDTDSVAGFDDSDREDANGRPPSRRSFSSTDSSRDGEVQGWEGLAEEASDEPHVLRASLFTEPPPISTRTAALVSDAVSSQPADEDPEEEQRVKDALDQSMMSTLSSSRSNSLAGSHTSIVQSRDLRLSFPDPLTSSRDELLNTSYEDVSPSDADMPPSDAGLDTHAPATDSDVTTYLAPTAADPGSLAIPAVPQDDASDAEPVTISPDLYIVLYGSSSAMKWSLIDKLLEKTARGAGLVLSSKILGLVDGCIRFLTPGAAASENESGRVVTVIDRTELYNADDDSSFVLPLDRPSLAIIFLPSAITTLHEHTLYLPVFTQTLSIIGMSASTDQLFDAEQQWETFGIPRSKLAKFSRSASSVVDQEEIERARPLQVARACRPLFDRCDKKSTQRLSSKHAFTLFAVLSVVLGYVINGSLTASTLATVPVRQQISPPLWGLVRPITSSNQTAPAATTSVSSALIPSSLKEFALAVLNPAPLIASTLGSRQSPTSSTSGHNQAEATTTPSECTCGCGLITWPEKVRSATDLMLRPIPPAPALSTKGDSEAGFPLVSHQPHGNGKGKAVVRADESLYTLSTRIVGTLSEYFDFRTVTAVVVEDLQEILDALDALVHAIGRQTILAWEQSKDTVQALRTHIQERHVRARAKALQLREMGGRFISSVHERVRGRATTAKDNARSLRESVLTVDAWKNPRARREEAFRLRRMARKDRRQARVVLKH
ncbi:hypothetical protein AcV7_006394 [Taiwanofungus camphoratus]|nr:hypothetical protein AcV7_006394 [Antrodia cinnamomea]